MADKLAVADWDIVPGNNDNIAGMPLIEGETYPSHVNNAFRAMMAQVKAKFGLVDGQLTPAGVVVHTARSTAPAGFLKANGAAISRTTYAALFAAIGTTFGGGDGSTTFNVPDLRGEFVRALDDGRSVDAGRTLGSAQGDQIKSHNHGASADVQGWHDHSGGTYDAGNHTHNLILRGGSTQAPDGPRIANGTTGVNVGSGAIEANGNHSHGVYINANGNHSHNITVNAAGGAEVRVRNIALLACIKY